jgi:hypothetical protein
LADLAHFQAVVASPELSRRDADDPLEVGGELALVREADPECDLNQTEAAICAQEVLSPLNPPPNYILMWRQPGRRFNCRAK